MFLSHLKKSKFILNLRNSINFRSVPIVLPSDENSYSISDAFCWRKSNDFKTNFRYTDLINYFTHKKNNSVKLVLSDHSNKIIDKVHLNPSQLTDNIKVTNLLNKVKETSGHFFIFHKLPLQKDETIVLRNSCYTSFSFKGNTPSIVHGNLPVVAEDKRSVPYKKNIIQGSNFINYIYKVQHNFLPYDKVEVFFFNPLNKTLKIKINEMTLYLDKHNSLITKLPLSGLYTIKSKCLLLRPIFFVYKDTFFDTFHG